MKFKILPFINGLQTTFSDMADIHLEDAKIGSFTGSEFYSDYTCSIGLMGIERASLILTLSHKAAISITTKITGRVLNGNEKIITDTIGEILNIAVGVAQKGSDEKFNFSLPVSINGTHHQIHVISDSKTIRAVLVLDGEEICLYLTNAQIME